MAPSLGTQAARPGRSLWLGPILVTLTRSAPTCVGAHGTGTWSIEATIDGLPSGAFTFEVVDTGAPLSGPSRRPLPPSELYRQLNAVYVSIDRFASRGGLIDSNAGFVISPSGVATAFSAIDAADRLEMSMAGGERQSVTSIAVWDRRQDWAVIPKIAAVAPPLPIASRDSAEVGDRCYSMEGGAAGRRVLTECTIVGRTGELASPSFIVRFLDGHGVAGAPVLNEFGEVIGLITGAPLRGVRGPVAFRPGPDPGFPVVPASALRPDAGEEAVSLQDLRRRGVLMLAVSEDDNLLNGGFARQIHRNPLRPIDQREEFSRAGGRFFAFLSWDPISHWELSVPRLPGSYRTDVLVGDVPIWRGFFRITP